MKEKPSTGRKQACHSSRDPATGRFLPGNRTGGRPQLPEELKEAFRARAPDALRVLAKIMMDEEARHADRIRAAEIILDRGYGKPQVAVEIDSTGDNGLGVVMIPQVLAEEVEAQGA